MARPLKLLWGLQWSLLTVAAPCAKKKQKWKSGCDGSNHSLMTKVTAQGPSRCERLWSRNFTNILTRKCSTSRTQMEKKKCVSLKNLEWKKKWQCSCLKYNVYCALYEMKSCKASCKGKSACYVCTLLFLAMMMNYSVLQPYSRTTGNPLYVIQNVIR